MNRRGQALVEFVIVLPILIFIVMAVYDFGHIFTVLSKLENDSTDIIMLYQNGKELTEIKNIYPDIDIEISPADDYQKVTIKESINVVTPGFNLIFGSPYTIKTERFIKYE